MDFGHVNGKFIIVAFEMETNISRINNNKSEIIQMRILR